MPAFVELHNKLQADSNRDKFHARELYYTFSSVYTAKALLEHCWEA